MSLAADFAIVSAGLEDKRRDPLRWYQHSSWASEWVAANLHRGWIYWHAANSGGKSRSLAALWLALLRGLPTLGGIAIPRIAPPVHGGLGCPTYKIGAAGSILDAIRELAGEWPHHEDKVPEGGFSAFYVMHQDHETDDRTRWSKLVVCPYNGPVPEGARWDFWGADEPPPEDWLSAAMNRGKAGRPLYGAIGATPIKRKTWWPIKRQFPEQPMEFVNGRARIQSSVYDNRFLTAADLRRQEMANPPEHPLYRAKLYGDHVSTSGKCPFHEPTLMEMLSLCRDPDLQWWTVSRETHEGVNQKERVQLEVWEKPEAGASYYFPVDPAAGIDDAAHDPLGMLGAKIGPCDLVARYGGYLQPYSLGVLQAGVCRQYNGATADIEMNDRWGVNVHHGLTGPDGMYHLVAKEKRELRPGEWAQEIGFHNNAQTRPVIIGAVQTWVNDWAQGLKYARCPSAKVIQCLLDCELDDDGKIVAEVGSHDEDLILWGQCLRRALKRSGREIPRLSPKVKTGDERMIEKAMARRDGFRPFAIKGRRGPTH